MRGLTPSFPFSQYTYDPFGYTTSQSGAWASANPYRFSSKEIDYKYFAGGDNYYYGYRFYHPVLHRWLNRDPIGINGGINLYGFVGNNPVGGIDPYGLELGVVPGGGHWSQPGGPLEYITGDSFLEQAGASVFNTLPLFYNSVNGLLSSAAHTVDTVANAVDNGVTHYSGYHEVGEGFGNVARAAAVVYCPGLKGPKAVRSAPKKTVKPGGYNDKPPGWNKDWEWLPSERLRKKARDRGEPGWRWHDERGGEWRRHGADKDHPEAHWDYSPNRNWGDEWFNVDDSGNLIFKGF